MNQFPATITARQRFSEQLLQKLRNRLRTMREMSEMQDLCAYATGSFARGDASKVSDLDIFFIDRGESCSTIQMSLVSADLIRTCRRLKLPEFSDGGRYLKLHKLNDITSKLGSPEDDHQNYFTARMLLLLESAPISPDHVYDHIVKSIIDAYFRDYHDHDIGFKPIFLVNDIIRFWKTLCLNYENKRTRSETEKVKKHSSHLKNLKLKFSRLTTCYSMILSLAQSHPPITPTSLLTLVRRRPLDRIRTAAHTVEGGPEIANRLMEEYSWFLRMTGVNNEAALNWIGNKSNRETAFKRAREYGNDMFLLLRKVANDEDKMRYLVM